MRKVLLGLAVLLSATVASAQTKNLDKALADTQNAKKAENPATWVKLGAAYMDAYDTPTRGIWQGASQMEVKMILKDQQILNSTQEEIAGVSYNVDEYADKKLYYDEAGQLQAWVVTKPVVAENALLLSLDAFVKANEKDVKKAQTKAIEANMLSLKDKFVNDAMNYYTIGNYKSASENFEYSLKVSGNPILGLVDSTIIYYTAVTAAMAKENDKAINYFEKCLAINYDMKGDVYSTLAESYKATGDTLKAKDVLSAGFTKYPTSQSILVSLINIYQESNDDPNKILDLIKVAQSNEPNNASLYYAEGNIYKKMGEYAKAYEAYDKSLSTDPNYFFAPFAKGDCYYSEALDYQNKANEERDDAKYEEYIKLMETALENAIEPFEKAFSITKDNDFQVACAEYLKNIFFRFREKNEEYKAKYEKYNNFASQAK